MESTKFCKYCGEKVPYDAVICTKCGRQIESFDSRRDDRPIIINNSSSSSSSSVAMGGYGGKPLSKWTAFFLCLFLGPIGAHKFYEGKTFMGIIYLFTLGFFGLGWALDLLILLFRSNPYYIR